MTTAFVYDAVRTPFGKFNGGLAGVRPDDLAAAVLTAIRDRNPELDPGAVDEVILGNANGAGEENRNVARMAACSPGSRSPCRARRSTGSAVRRSTPPCPAPG